MFGADLRGKFCTKRRTPRLPFYDAGNQQSQSLDEQPFAGPADYSHPTLRY